MKRVLFYLFLLISVVFSSRGQSITADYFTYERGFWVAGEFRPSYTLLMSSSNSSVMELDVTGGYRFNDFVRIGIGFGGRYYINSDRIRKGNINWSFPIYANIRGNFIPTGYRDVVPYYSVDFGGSIRDGLMWRPTIGIRVGQQRSAFLLGLTYTGQSLINNHNDRIYCSMLGLTLGYEY